MKKIRSQKGYVFQRLYKGLFSAIPHGSEVLAGLFKIKEICDIAPIFHVYVLDKRDLKESDIIDSEQLYLSKRVLDAKLTKEVWILTENIKPKHKLVEIVDFTVEKELILCKNEVKIVSHIECNWFDFTPKDITTNNHVKQSLGFWKWMKKEYKKRHSKELSMNTIRSFLAEY